VLSFLLQHANSRLKFITNVLSWPKAGSGSLSCSVRRQRTLFQTKLYVIKSVCICFPFLLFRSSAFVRPYHQYASSTSCISSVWTYLPSQVRLTCQLYQKNTYSYLVFGTSFSMKQIECSMRNSCLKSKKLLLPVHFLTYKKLSSALRYRLVSRS
jgi:hypothetical protein